MPRGSEVAVINMAKKGFTKKVTFEQAHENILEGKHSGRPTVSPRVLSRIVPGVPIQNKKFFKMIPAPQCS